MTKMTRQNWQTGVAAAAFAAAVLSSTPAFAQVTLTYLVDTDNPTNVATAEQIKTDFEAQNPNIKIEIETRPGGSEGDNLIKTRLATGDMADTFRYNAGSLFQALSPSQTMLDLTNEQFMANIISSFKPTVTGPDGRVYGVPEESAMGGGILYNRRIYDELGLSVPKTWAEFMDNNAKIKEAGKVPVIQSYGTTWTSQLFVLGDFYNVLAAEPDFAQRYTAGEAKYATSAAAIKGFQRLEELHSAGYWNEDFASATLPDALRMLAEGEGAHYPMLSFAIGVIAGNHPEHINDIGFFAIPGEDASKNGLTVWMPAAVYVSATTPHPEEAKKLVAFIASTEGCDARTRAHGTTGPFLIKGCTLPSDVAPAVLDLLPYFQADGLTAPALEFLSPVKGPALEQLTVEVGSGIRSAADAAALYDEDVRKQAQQLGLPGW